MRRPFIILALLVPCLFGQIESFSEGYTPSGALMALDFNSGGVQDFSWANNTSPSLGSKCSILRGTLLCNGGSTSMVEVASAKFIASCSNNFTLCVWVYPYSNGNGSFIGKTPVTDAGGGLASHIYQFVNGCNFEIGSHDLAMGAAPAINWWTCYIADYNGITMNFYRMTNSPNFNVTTQTSSAFTNADLATHTVFKVGHYYNGGYFYTGQVAYAAICRGQLTAAERREFWLKTKVNLKTPP